MLKITPHAPALLRTAAAAVFVGPEGKVNVKAFEPFASSAPSAIIRPELRLSEKPLMHHSICEGSATGTTLYAVSEFSNKTSRFLGPLRADNLLSCLKKILPKTGDVVIVLYLNSNAELLTAAAAIARLCSAFTKKTKHTPRNFYLDFCLPSTAQSIDYAVLQAAADAVRHCARLSDMPCSELDCDELVSESQRVVDALRSDLKANIACTVIRGEELKKQGFGGIYAVGKGARTQPALVVLSRVSSKDAPCVAMVGKGIVFDTGGLSLKQTTSMCGMKHDMAGAAAVLAAFDLLARTSTVNMHAILCIAENAIGPDALRNDDIVTMFSKLTVEINNTDAEGRLVLADGVAYASQHLNPKHIITVATLTGAQMVATGLHHAGALCSTAFAQDAVSRASVLSGDLSFPMVYAPELLLAKQFESEVADYKNSVKDRTNAPSSAAGHFIEAHLHPDYEGSFIHLDIAGPSTAGERATGYGPALLSQLLPLLAK